MGLSQSSNEIPKIVMPNFKVIYRKVILREEGFDSNQELDVHTTRGSEADLFTRAKSAWSGRITLKLDVATSSVSVAEWWELWLT